ncbi:conserved hypothetical protein [uncultured delta proteobacterium]|uniref:WbqC-like family protein n=1 Tax=uncultured delta proteobacterium TaxID=34034 RepID=A0A212KCX6_9DELT|nr:conserved hypothetical protein [uncultured delta proteobacterium]
MKKVAILQSNYIPWKGYFDIIARVDEFILYDEMQFTKNDWRNRNIIKTQQGPLWLTIPVGQDINRRICDVPLPGGPWRMKHWKTLVQNYSHAPCFKETAAWLEPLYRETQTTLSALNRRFIEEICRVLGIRTLIRDSSEYVLGEGKTERLVNLCRQTGADEYVSGPAARGYLDERLFADQGVRVTWMDYANYPEYPQLHGAFTHQVSILDLLFNRGADAPRFMRHVRP